MSVSSAAVDAGIDGPAIARDGTALQRAFMRCGVALYRYIRVRTGDDHVADDLMQQLWLQCQRGGEGVPEDRLEFAFWAIARNLVRTHWRKQRRRPAHVPVEDPRLAAELAQRLANEELPPAQLERKELRDQLLLAVTELPATEQELIIGFHFEDRSYGELAERLGLSVRAIEGRLYRARAALRERLASFE